MKLQAHDGGGLSQANLDEFARAFDRVNCQTEPFEHRRFYVAEAQPAPFAERLKAVDPVVSDDILRIERRYTFQHRHALVRGTESLPGFIRRAQALHSLLELFAGRLGH